MSPENCQSRYAGASFIARVVFYEIYEIGDCRPYCGSVADHPTKAVPDIILYRQYTFTVKIHFHSKHSIFIKSFQLKGGERGGEYPVPITYCLDLNVGSFRNNCVSVVVFGRSGFNFTSCSYLSCLLGALGIVQCRTKDQVRTRTYL